MSKLSRSNNQEREKFISAEERMHRIKDRLDNLFYETYIVFTGEESAAIAMTMCARLLMDNHLKEDDLFEGVHANDGEVFHNSLFAEICRSVIGEEAFHYACIDG